MYNPAMRCSPRVVAAAFASMVAATLVSTSEASAAAPWIYRGLTLPSHDVALDFGLGYGHAYALPDDIDGWGLNLELRAGITHTFELGFRIGFRLDDGGRATQADYFGRPFETETYGTLFDSTSNPELKFRWSVARSYAAELGLELRAYLPIEAGSRFGFMFGLPIALRAGIVRLDTGLFVPVIFYPQTLTVVSIPLHIWIQAAHNVWVGPLLGLQVISQNGSRTAYPLGFGLGLQAARNVDLRTWFLFRDMNQDRAARYWGAGVGLEVRFE
jgi:hypothetical protein